MHEGSSQEVSLGSTNGLMISSGEDIILRSIDIELIFFTL